MHLRSALLFLCLFFSSVCFTLFSQDFIAAPLNKEIISPDETGAVHYFIQELMTSYFSSCVNGTRILMETGEKVRYRYEFVSREGTDKIVVLKMPYSVTWFRFGEEGYLVQDDLKIKAPILMKDLEDVFIEKLCKLTTVFIVSEITYSNIPAFYVIFKFQDGTEITGIFLKESLQIIRLEYHKLNSFSILIYDNLTELSSEDFSFQKEVFNLMPEASETLLPIYEEPKLKLLDSATLTEMPLEAKKAVEDFLDLIFYIRKRYEILNIDILDFSDATSLFVTINLIDSEPVGIVLTRMKENNKFPSSPFPVNLQKPEGFNSVIKRSNNFEINVVGKSSLEKLEELAKDVLGFDLP